MDITPFLRTKCECGDPSCPVHGTGECKELASTTLHRIDMADETGTRMCSECADDATRSGLFIEREDWATDPILSGEIVVEPWQSVIKE